jgi:hypothetical protein
VVVSRKFELYGIPGGGRRLGRTLAIEGGGARPLNVPTAPPEDVRAFL